MNAVKWIAGIGLIVIAVLVHTYYISYVTNGRHYLYSWPALPSQHEAFLEGVARLDMRRDKQTTILVPSNNEVARRRTAYLRDSGNCRLKRNLQAIPSLDRYFALRDPANYTCKPAWVPPKQQQITRIIKGVTYDEALAKAKKRLPAQSRYGMVPSYNTTAKRKPTPAEMARCLWLGLILPSIMGLVGLGLVVATWKNRQRRAIAPDAQSSRPLPASAPVAIDQQASLGDLLRARFGSGIGRGNATQADPLVITEVLDYVGLEWAVSRFLMQGLEHKLKKQTLTERDGRKIDALEFLTKEHGAQEWEGQRRFYFDITAGFDRLRR